MKSRTTIKFCQAFAKLPASVQKQARNAYRLFKKNPNHPSLRFKKVHQRLPIYSARISKDYRAVGQLDGETVIWFWIGAHTDYEKLLSGLEKFSYIVVCDSTQSVFDTIKPNSKH